MNAVLRAFLLFTILLVLVLLLGQAGSMPLPVTLTINTLVLKTTAPVAITLAVIILLLAFYAGRLTGWMLRIPHKLLSRRKTAAAENIANAYTALALHDLPLAVKQVNDLKTDNSALQDLISLIQLHTATITTTQAQKNLTNPRLSALTALYLARSAATQLDWPEVKRLTTIGRQTVPQNLPLLTLQFKSLVNLNDSSASELLPVLKPHLGPHRHKILSQLLQANPTPTTLNDPWTKSFQSWLPDSSDTFPSDE